MQAVLWKRWQCECGVRKPGFCHASLAHCFTLLSETGVEKILG